jgi:hypothetical protein
MFARSATWRKFKAVALRATPLIRPSLREGHLLPRSAGLSGENYA